MSTELFTSTVWKIEDFTVIQNLREINFGKLKIKNYHFDSSRVSELRFWQIFAKLYWLKFLKSKFKILQKSRKGMFFEKIQNS